MRLNKHALGDKGAQEMSKGNRLLYLKRRRHLQQDFEALQKYLQPT